MVSPFRYFGCTFWFFPVRSQFIWSSDSFAPHQLSPTSPSIFPLSSHCLPIVFQSSQTQPPGFFPLLMWTFLPSVTRIFLREPRFRMRLSSKYGEIPHFSFFSSCLISFCHRYFSLIFLIFSYFWVHFSMLSLFLIEYFR